MHSQFDLAPRGLVDDYGVQYDFMSVMHYASSKILIYQRKLFFLIFLREVVINYKLF